MTTLLRRNWGRTPETEESAAELAYFSMRNAAAARAIDAGPALLACRSVMGEIELAQRFTGKNSGAK
jgi:hypothetical protein